MRLFAKEICRGFLKKIYLKFKIVPKEKRRREVQ